MAYASSNTIIHSVTSYYIASISKMSNTDTPTHASGSTVDPCALDAPTDNCTCVLAAMKHVTEGNVTFLAYSGRQPSVHSAHNVVEDVRRVLSPSVRPMKAADCRSLVSLIPGTNRTKRTFCMHCVDYRNSVHVCIAEQRVVGNDWLGDALHVFDVRRVSDAQLATEQEKYTCRTAQTDYLRNHYPTLVLPPPTSDHTNSTTFEHRYYESLVFRALYLYRMIRGRRFSPICSVVHTCALIIFSRHRVEHHAHQVTSLIRQHPVTTLCLVGSILLMATLNA